MLIIALPHSTNTDPSYAYVHSDGHSVLHSASGPAATLSPHEGEVVAVIPHTRLAWLRVQLPPASHGPRLQSVLHGLLEDRLLDELDQLHIVLDPAASSLTRTGGDAWVAVCNKQWLRDTLTPLQTAGLTVQRIVPELLPSQLPVLHVMGEPQHAQNVLCHVHGVTLLPLNIKHWHAVTDLNQNDFQIQAEPAMVAHVQSTLQEQPTLESAAQRWVKSSQSSWDLAQGEWAQGRVQRVQKLVHSIWKTVFHAPAWKPVRWGICALIALQVLGLNALAWREHSLLNARQTSLNNILTSTFPAVTLVLDAPVQMQREVNALQQKTGTASNTDLEPLLAVLANLLPPGQTPQQIDFANRALRIQGIALDENVATRLKPSGLNFRQDGNNTWVLQAEGQK